MKNFIATFISLTQAIWCRLKEVKTNEIKVEKTGNEKENCEICQILFPGVIMTENENANITLYPSAELWIKFIYFCLLNQKGGLAGKKMIHSEELIYDKISTDTFLLLYFEFWASFNYTSAT